MKSILIYKVLKSHRGTPLNRAAKLQRISLSPTSWQKKVINNPGRDILVSLEKRLPERKNVLYKMFCLIFSIPASVPPKNIT